MMGPTHALVGGSTAFVATSALGLPWEYVGVATVCSAATSSLPDDAEKWLRLPHRKTTHRPAVQIAFFGLLAVAASLAVPTFATLAVLLAAPLTLGCVMHSCADAMTVERHGIQLLWPISRRGYHLLPRFMRVWVGSKSRSEAT